MAEQVATFGAGCFWGVEARFRACEGVTDVVVGYSGGHTREPGYRDVCGGDTGHVEVAQVHFDDSQVSYQDLLDLFFDMHNPTTRNRQGPDVGEQYRSVVFAHDEGQAEQARATIAALEASGRFKSPIVTTVEPAGEFWRAEEYHQRYLEKKGLASCHI